MSERTALVLGATGLIGRHVVELLLADPRWSRVRVLARRPLPFTSEKLDFHAVDFERLSDCAELFAADDIFCCLGTTMKEAGSREAFRRVDLDYPTDAARYGHVAGARHFLLISSWGANPRSRIFYNRVKGEVEGKIRSAAYQRLTILRPPVLLGAREHPRPLERLGQLALRLLAPLLVGPLANLRPIEGRDVAKAMVRLAAQPGEGERTLEPKEIHAEAS